jgi:hypothetical protein
VGGGHCRELEEDGETGEIIRRPTSVIEGQYGGRVSRRWATIDVNLLICPPPQPCPAYRWFQWCFAFFQTVVQRIGLLPGLGQGRAIVSDGTGPALDWRL